MMENWPLRFICSVALLGQSYRQVEWASEAMSSMPLVAFWVANACLSLLLALIVFAKGVR
jgi:hypothetical protein